MEHDILLFIQENLRVAGLNEFMAFYSDLGEDGILGVLSVLALSAYPKTRKIGLIAGLSFFIGAVVIRGVLKFIVMRPRPFVTFTDIVPLFSHPHSSSFPSGHTMAMFSVAWVLLRSEFNKLKWLFFALACLMGFSRIYLGVHYPTDVLGGAIIALIGSYIAWEWAKRIKFIQKW